MSASISTSATKIVSPVVTQYAPNATIGLSTDAQETVTVNGINQTFTYNLATATDARAFLNAFDLSGLRYDEINGQVDEDLSALDLKVNSDINTYIAAAVNGAQAGNQSLKQWLNAELRAAFLAAFPGYLASSAVGSDISDASDNVTTGEGEVAAQTAVSGLPLPPGGQAADAVDATTLATIVRNTFINSFAVDVDVSGGAAASSFATQFNGAAAILRASLYRQIANASWMQYYTMGSPSDGIGSGLPLLGGDKLVFVFDVDVNATTGGTHTGAPTPVTANTILLNLGNRRVALEFVMPGEAGALIAQ